MKRLEPKWGPAGPQQSRIKPKRIKTIAEKQRTRPKTGPKTNKTGPKIKKIKKATEKNKNKQNLYQKIQIKRLN